MSESSDNGRVAGKMTDPALIVVTDDMMTDPTLESFQLALLALMPPANELPI